MQVFSVRAERHAVLRVVDAKSQTEHRDAPRQQIARGDVEMGCNQETGQCFYMTVNAMQPGGNGVCSPGSNCEVVVGVGWYA